MALSAKDLKAIDWYAKSHGAKPQLSTPPVIYFKSNSGTQQYLINLADLHVEYEQWNEQDKKERAQERKNAKSRQ